MSRFSPPSRCRVEQEEQSAPKLRAMIHELLREADRGQLQLAYKLLRALLR